MGIADGMIHRAGKGGDIVTSTEYLNFELEFDWKVAPGANSGLKYRFGDYGGQKIGLEFQVLDDEKHENGKDPKTSAGSIYELVAPARPRNSSPSANGTRRKSSSRDSHIEHWVNGEKVLTATLGSDEWKAALAKSKFRERRGFWYQRRAGFSCRIMVMRPGSGICGFGRWTKNEAAAFNRSAGVLMRPSSRSAEGALFNFPLSLPIPRHVPARMKACEIFQRISPALGAQIVGYLRDEQKDVYRATVATLAQHRKLRPQFVQKKTREQQAAWILETLRLKTSEAVGEQLLQVWLMKAQSPMLVKFLDALGISHDGNGAVDDLPRCSTRPQVRERGRRSCSRISRRDRRGIPEHFPAPAVRRMAGNHRRARRGPRLKAGGVNGPASELEVNEIAPGAAPEGQRASQADDDGKSLGERPPPGPKFRVVGFGGRPVDRGREGRRAAGDRRGGTRRRGRIRGANRRRRPRRD